MILWMSYKVYNNIFSLEWISKSKYNNQEKMEKE